MEAGTIVRNSGGEMGVVIEDLPGPMGVCSPEEELVVYDGTDAGMGTERTDLELVGTYEQKIDKPERCGVGLGEFCCRYLSMVGGDFMCQRFSSLRDTIIFRSSTMAAQGEPRHIFPGCQEDIMLAANNNQET